MTTEERNQFGNKLQAFWPRTSEDAGILILEQCERFGIEVVEQAMEELRIAMPGHHLMADGHRLLMVCKRIVGEKSDSIAAKEAFNRTRKYLEEQSRWKHDAETFIAELDKLHVDPEVEEKAYAACLHKYPACWNGFSAHSKARLMKLWIKENHQ